MRATVLRMLAEDAWGAVGGIASFVGAAAVLIAVLYARETVREARAARAEAHADHLETIREQEKATDAARDAQRVEMADRERAYQAERALQRGAQVQRIADLLLELVEVARDEDLNPPPMASGGAFRSTRIPALVIRLRGALGHLAALGGPALETTEKLARERQTGDSPLTTLGDAVSSLAEIEFAVANDDSLRIPSSETKPTQTRASL